MGRLGVKQAEAKIYLPSRQMIWLGIHFDTDTMIMAVPKQKMREVMACLDMWLGKTRATRNEMQSLLGLLNFVASVAPPARLFTNRMLDDLREAPPYGATSLPLQFKQDVRFFVELLPIFNGRKIMGKRVIPYQHQVELDVCLTGCGAVAGDQYYATPFPEQVLEKEHTIAHLELLNASLQSRCGGPGGPDGLCKFFATILTRSTSCSRANHATASCEVVQERCSCTPRPVTLTYRCVIGRVYKWSGQTPFPGSTLMSVTLPRYGMTHTSARRPE